MIGLGEMGGAILRRLPPETAHHAALKMLRFGLASSDQESDPHVIAHRCWGLDFGNPIGLAAGFDKDAEAVSPLLAQGFGSIEVGTVTPLPQTGNRKPRVFRLSKDGAVINRLGFNNRGVEIIARRLARARPYRGVVGANIGPNKNSDNPLDDYRTCFTRLAPLVDYLVVNISSPNTPGLRAWQDQDSLSRLVSTLQDRRAGLSGSRGGSIPLLIKIAPDLDERSRGHIASVALAQNLDGLLIANTTVSRPSKLQSPSRMEPGGLSGRPLFQSSTSLLADMYRRVDGSIPLIGIGGVNSGDDAYLKIRAGASLVQLYTALIYHGPSLISRIKLRLAERLHADGFENISSVVGIDAADY